MNRSFLRIVFGASAALLGASFLFGELGATEALFPARIAGHGVLQIAADSSQRASADAPAAAEKERPWSIDVQRTSGTSYEGRITMISKEGLEEAGLYSEVSWPNVTGIVVNDSGERIATFEGTVSLIDGVKGEFVTIDGQTGSWSFDIP